MEWNVMDLVLWAQFPGGQRQAPDPAQMAGAMAGMICYFGFLFVFVGLMIASLWKIFDKAGEPGWAAIVPVYNAMILSKICGRGEAFGLLLLVPCVNVVVSIMLTFDLARVFGKDTGFAIGLLLLGFVFYPMLAFGDARYRGNGSAGPGRRRRIDDDDDDRPRRRRPSDDDDDDRPRRRRAAVDDDEDDAPPPRRRRPVDDDEDDDAPPPPRRRPAR